MSPVNPLYIGDDGEGDFEYILWEDIESGIDAFIYPEDYFEDTPQLEFSDINLNEEFDCEIFDYSRSRGEKIIRQHPIFSNLLISKNGQVGGIYFNLDNRIKTQESRALFFKFLQFGS